MADLESLVDLAARVAASDVVLSAGEAPRLRCGGELLAHEGPALDPGETEACARRVVGSRWDEVVRSHEFDGAVVIGGRRLRANVFRQRGSWGVVLRILAERIPEPEGLGLPEPFVAATALSSGLVLVTGPTGSGKTTSLAALVARIQATRSCHVVTIEDPVEYAYPHGLPGVVEQREVGLDTRSFSTALRAALRENPDVMLVGELRDLETVRLALIAAETGHLVFATVHAEDAAAVPGRVAGVFPPGEQGLARAQLAGSLRLVVAQRLLPRRDGRGAVAAFDVMVCTAAVRALIRDGKDEQLPNVLATSAREGMVPLHVSVGRLVRAGTVAPEVALAAVPHPRELERWLASA